MPEEKSKDFKYLVRIANTDLKGEKQIGIALTKIKGIGFMFANTVCNLAKININKRSGDLTEQETEKLNSIILEPAKAGIPIWMFNRRRDYITGEDTHIITNDLKFVKDSDLKRMMKTKSYKGLRHQWGQPVRGQRTKNNFRVNKGKVTGVKKKSTTRK